MHEWANMSLIRSSGINDDLNDNRQCVRLESLACVKRGPALMSANDPAVWSLSRPEIPCDWPNGCI